MELIIVTGLSGAGKSTVIHALEDIGYFCIDNLPVRLIPVIANSVLIEGGKEKLAVVCDIRSGMNADDTKEAVASLEEKGIRYKIVYLDCKTEVLLNRFRLTRRSHPLVSGECDGISQAVAQEKKLFQPIRAMADYVIDTSDLSLNLCKNRIFDFFSEKGDSVKIHCVSFGFKYGLPEDADYIFDVRSLPNPYYVQELKPMTGLDERVSNFVMSFPEAQEFSRKLTDFAEFFVPLCIKDGRSSLVIATGCTGGHHRSVTFIEILYKHLLSLGYTVSVSHRDIDK